MKNLCRGLLCAAILVGTATPSEAFICCLINKIVECPPVRKMRNEHRAAKAAHKMKAKKPHTCCLKKLLDGCCDCDSCGGECCN